MDPRVRIMAASGVMLGGFLLALLFRHPAGKVDLPPMAETNGPLVMRKQAVALPLPVVPEPNRGVRAAGPASTAASEPGRPSPALLKPEESAASPPDAARPVAARPQGTSRWGISMGQMLPERPHPASTTHKIVDGDTLDALAERYLGAKDRAADLFEANRDVLSHPQLLPIGTELKIPSPSPPPVVLPANPLVPIDRRS